MTVSSVRRIVEYAVFVPVGLVTELQRDAGRVVDEGRQRIQGQLTVARAVGELTVRVLTARVRARLDGEPVDVDRPSDQPVPAPAPAAAETDGPAAAPPLADVAPAMDADELPIDDYESLAASQVVARLPTLAVDELDAVERFEQQHRRRRTVLGKIEQLRRSR